MDWVCVLLVAVSVRYGAVCARALFVMLCVICVLCIRMCCDMCVCVDWMSHVPGRSGCSLRLSCGLVCVA